MRNRLIALLLLLGLGGGYIAYVELASNGPGAGNGKYAKPAAGKNGKGGPPVPVTVGRVRVQDVVRRVEAVGRGQASETVTLKARIDGQVAEVPFSEGRHVRRGDLLVRLDPADHQARLKLAEANLARGQAAQAKARADLGRYVELRSSGFVSEEKVLELRAVLEAAEAQVKADLAAVDLARLQLGYTTLFAPIDGVIGGKLVFPGGTVKANDTALAVINRVRPLHVVFALPERHLPRLRAAMAGGGLSARIAVDGNPAHGTDGRVSFIDNAVDPATGTIQLKATLANADEALAPGQFVTVSLALEVLKGVATVPAEAVQQGPHGAFAFVVRDDLGIEQRGVEVIDNRDGMAVIDRGLKEGETVVTDGHLRLTPKSRVQVKQAVTK